MTLPSIIIDSLQMTYSAEKAAAFAYIGHANSVSDPIEKLAIKQIENDEWYHRAHVLDIMLQYGIKPSKMYEIRFHIIGRMISASCYVIGWFMPYYFAGRLESGNVCEYFKMIHLFHSIGIEDHDKILLEMGLKEKDHELYFLSKIQDKKSMYFFEKIFGWGNIQKMNDIIESKYPSIEEADLVCKK